MTRSSAGFGRSLSDVSAGSSGVRLLRRERVHGLRQARCPSRCDRARRPTKAAAAWLSSLSVMIEQEVIVRAAPWSLVAASALAAKRSFH